MALERERMVREVRWFRDVAEAVGPALAAEFLPVLLDFDAQNSVLAMEYLAPPYGVLFEQLHRRCVKPPPPSSPIGVDPPSSLPSFLQGHRAQRRRRWPRRLLGATLRPHARR